jgi:ribosomal protein S27AE
MGPRFLCRECFNEKSKEYGRRSRGRRKGEPIPDARLVKERKPKPYHPCIAKAQVYRYRNRHPERYEIALAVDRAIDKGILVRPDKCSRCGEGAKIIQAHHPDYSKPLEVIWVCPACHATYHPRRKWRDGLLSRCGPRF